MRRSLWICAPLLALSLLACETQPLNDFARLRGLADIEKVGRYVFIVSSHNSELRVIDSEADAAAGRETPGFVRAPNPLNLLSIPVLDRPMALAPDVHFNAEGAEVRGPYLYVQGSGARELSVVGAQPEVLKELARLPTGGPVTALTGVGPAAAEDPSTLIYAETVGGAARLFSVRLPPPGALEGLPAAAPLLRADGVPTYWPEETVAALVTLPRAEDGNLRIAVAFRQASGTDGRTELWTLDPTGARAVGAPVLLDFGGPVRQLQTHARATRLVGEGEEAVREEVLPAGARIFGALDEAACGGRPACSGVVAVDAITLSRPERVALTQGQRALDIRGLPMATLGTEGALLLDFALLPGLARATVGPGVVVEMDLGGVMISGRGYYTLFDAVNLQTLNVSSDLPSITTGSVGYFEADGTAVPVALTGTVSQLVNRDTTRLNHGVVQTEVVMLVYRGELPDLRNLELGPLSGVSLLPDGLLLSDPTRIARLRVGDEVLPVGEAGCPERLVVDALDAMTGEILTTPAPTEACRTVTFWAGGTEPWVVSGSRSGYLGRAVQGEVFESGEGVPFAHLPTYVPGGPQMAFRFVLPSGLVPTQGQFLRFSTLDGYIAQEGRLEEQIGPNAWRAVEPSTQLILMPASLDFPFGSIWGALGARNQITAFSPTNILTPDFQIGPLQVLYFR